MRYRKLPQKTNPFGRKACIGIVQRRRVEPCLAEERRDIEPPCLQRLRNSLDPKGGTAVSVPIHSCHRSPPRHLQWHPEMRGVPVNPIWPPKPLNWPQKPVNRRLE